MDIAAELKGAKALRALNTIIVIGGVIAAIATGYNFYINSVWRPSVYLQSVDYANGVAQVVINGGAVQTLYNGSIAAAGGVWGVRFNSNLPDGTPNRIELVKTVGIYPLVYEIYQ